MVRSVLVSLHNSMLDTDFTVCYEPANQEFWKNGPNNGIVNCRVRNHVQTGHCTEQRKAILQGSNGSSSSITHNCAEKQENLTICRHQEVSVSQSEWLMGVTNLCNSSLFESQPFKRCCVFSLNCLASRDWKALTKAQPQWSKSQWYINASKSFK